MLTSITLDNNGQDEGWAKADPLLLHLGGHGSTTQEQPEVTSSQKPPHAASFRDRVPTRALFCFIPVNMIAVALAPH